MKLKGLILFVIILFLVFGTKIYGLISFPDTQCTSAHVPNSKPIENPVGAQNFFDQGNYLYDSGKCEEAVGNYTRAIELNPNFAQAYNNRAYTNMRLRDYKDALSDLDKAILLKPDYVQALMNRGDIYNYYYQIDRSKAVADYNKVIALGAAKDTSVCGHKAMAETNNLLPLAFLNLFLNNFCK